MMSLMDIYCPVLHNSASTINDLLIIKISTPIQNEYRVIN